MIAKARTGAVIYRRVSTKEQSTNLSLPLQEKTCRAYCEKNGWEVLKVFTDSESAKTLDRTNFQLMLDFCGMNYKKIAAVVVHDGTRFSRETADALYVEAILHGKGIVVRFATQPVDDSPAGQLMKTMIYAYATFDNKTKAQRSIAGMKEAIESGLWVHRAPLGYINVSPVDCEAPNLLPDPQRAPLIRRAFEEYADGSFQKSQVLEHVTSLGLKDIAGRPVIAQSFDKMLRNPVYTGLIVSSFGVRARGRFEPIITDETFRRVQAVLAGRGTKTIERGSRNAEFPLRGFIRCSDCGTPLTASFSTGRHGGKYPYYFCREKTCRSVNCRREELHSQFMIFMEALRPNKDMWPLFAEALKDVWSAKHALQTQSKEHSAKRASDLNKRKDDLINALLAGKLIQKHFDEQITKADFDLATLNEGQLEELPEETELAALLDFAAWALENASLTWHSAESSLKTRIQQAFFPGGIGFSSAGFGTPESFCLFKQFATKLDTPDDLASPGGFEPPLPP
jgi:site-specific DNA recombinase